MEYTDRKAAKSQRELVRLNSLNANQNLPNKPPESSSYLTLSSTSCFSVSDKQNNERKITKAKDLRKQLIDTIDPDTVGHIVYATGYHDSFITEAEIYTSNMPVKHSAENNTASVVNDNSVAESVNISEPNDSVEEVKKPVNISEPNDSVEVKKTVDISEPNDSVEVKKTVDISEPNDSVEVEKPVDVSEPNDSVEEVKKTVDISEPNDSVEEVEKPVDISSSSPIDEIRNDVLFQPPRGSSIEEEAVIFRQMLLPFVGQGLQPEQLEKAVLILVQDRCSAIYDENESLFSIQMAKLYLQIARQEKLIPKSAKFYSLIKQSSGKAISDDVHYLAYVSSETPHREGDFNKIDQEVYVIHSIPNKAFSGKERVFNCSSLDTNNDGLLSIDEANASFSGLITNDSSNLQVETAMLTHVDDSGVSFFKKNTNISHLIRSINNSKDTIAKSIATKDIIKLQNQYISDFGEPVLPDNWNRESYKMYVRLQQLKDIINQEFKDGNQDVTPDSLYITLDEASHLIGYDGGAITAKDLNLSVFKRKQLLNYDARELGRNFTPADLYLKNNIKNPLYRHKIPTPEPLSLESLKFSQPPLGESPGEEAALFKETLKPYLNLSDEQRQKAFMLLVHNRIGGNYTHEDDSVAEDGSEEFYSSMKRTLIDRMKKIDCDDVMTAIKFYGKIAKQEGFLPSYVNIYGISLEGHAAILFKTKTSKGDEFYIMDNNIASIVGENKPKFHPDMLEEDRNRDGIWSPSEYEQNLYSLHPAELQSFSGFPIKEGDVISTEIDVNVFKDMYKNGVLVAGNVIGSSISTDKLIKIQQDYISINGKHKLPVDYHEIAYRDYVRAVEIKDILKGYHKVFNHDVYEQEIKVEDFNITSGQAKYLIGMHSDYLGRKLTIDDLKLSLHTKRELLKVESPMLGRPFNHQDLDLDTSITPIEHEYILPTITPLLKTNYNSVFPTSDNSLDINTSNVEISEIPQSPVKLSSECINSVSPPEIFQPPVSSSAIEETLSFREVLKPFIGTDLTIDQKQKIALVLIQDRYSKISEILDPFKSMQMARLYAQIAKAEGLLPETSSMTSVVVATSDLNELSSPDEQLMFLRYEHPTDETINLAEIVREAEGVKDAEDVEDDESTSINKFEIYVINNSLNKAIKGKWETEDSHRIDTNTDGLVSLKEFNKNFNFPHGRIANYSWTSDIDYYALDTLEVQSIFRDENITNYFAPSNLEYDAMMSELIQRSLSERNETVMSISRKEISKIQSEYIHEYGEPSLPNSWNNESIQDYMIALQLKDIIGSKARSGFADSIDISDLKITINQARYLIGAYSVTLERKITVADLELPPYKRIKLLGEDSPILHRAFTRDDLALSNDIRIAHEPLVPLIEPLSDKPLDFFQATTRGTTPEEFLAFRESLKPFLDLSASQKQKVFITLSMDRARKQMLEYDLTNETNEDKSIYYFSIMSMYEQAAKNCGFLSKDSNIILSIQDGEIKGIFAVKTEHGHEYYIIDDSTNKLVACSDYAKDKTINLDEIYKIYWPLDDDNEVTPSLIDLDSSHLEGLIEYGAITNLKTVADSISKAEIFKIQQDYIKQYGDTDIKIPEDFNEEEYSYYSRALKASEKLIDDENSSILKSLNITDREAKYLIGMYSESLQRKITIDDLHLDESTKTKLLNVKSFMLGRAFNYDDLRLQKPINPEDTLLTEITEPEGIKKSAKETTEEIVKDVKLSSNKNATTVTEETTETTETTEVAAKITEEVVQDFKSSDKVKSFFARTIDKIPSKIISGDFAAILSGVTQRQRYKKVQARGIAAEAYIKMHENITNRTNTEDTILQVLTPKDTRRLKRILSFKPGAEEITTTTPDSTTKLEEGITATEKPMTSEKANMKLLVDILLFDKMPINIDKIKKLVQLLLELRNSSDIHFYIDHKDKLSKLSNVLQTYSDDDLESLDKMDYINDILKYYGVKINCSTDRILGSYRVFNKARVTIRKKSKAVGHKVKFDKANFDGFLGIIKKLPLLTTVKDLIEEDYASYKTLSFFQDYDKEKEQYHKQQYYGKTAASLSSAIPIIPTNDIIKTGLLHKKASHLTRNRSIMHTRINNTIQLLNSSSLDEESKKNVVEKINNLLKTKNIHMGIKEFRDKGLRAVYAVSMVSTVPISITLGPVGSIVKSATKSTTTMAITIDSLYNRYLADAELIRKKEYQSINSVYYQLRDMYVTFEKMDDQEKMDIIAEVVFSLFNIPSDVFGHMIRSLAVEKDRVKLNLYQPIK